MTNIPAADAPAPFPLSTFRLGIQAMIALMLTSIAMTWRVGNQIREAAADYALQRIPALRGDQA